MVINNALPSSDFRGFLPQQQGHISKKHIMHYTYHS